MRLPDYALPSVTSIRPPFPLSEKPGGLTNALIAPVGCELIIQNPNPSQDLSMLKLVKDTISKIGMENPHLSELPLDAVGTGNTSRNMSSYFCYIQLSPEVTALDMSLRPDLLWQWKQLLLKALPG
jgi:hypothetical protein